MMPTGNVIRRWRITEPKFQSLFFWMMPTGPSSQEHAPFSPGFQSLFFWMMPTGSVLVACSPGRTSVSILVLLDDAYRRAGLQLT